MLKVHIRLNAALISGVGEKRRPGPQARQAYEVIAEFCREIVPEAVLCAVSDIDARPMHRNDIITTVEEFHPWSSNVPAIEIVVEPGDIDGSFHDRQSRCAAIVQKMYLPVVKFFTENWQYQFAVKRALESNELKIDIECRPLSATGQTINFAPGGAVRVEANWGALTY